MAWEYTYVTAQVNAVGQLVEALNEHGLHGWQVLGFASADKTVGLNAVTAILGREIVALSPPEADGAAWLPDPSHRFEKRYWDGLRWTWHVSTDGKQGRDAPTMLEPYPAKA